MTRPPSDARARFLLPSLVGVFIFLFPVFLEDRQTIVFGLLTDGLRSFTEEWLFEALLVLLATSGLGSLFYKIANVEHRSDSFSHLAFGTTWGWVALRNIGLLFGLAVYFQLGPTVVHASDTGVMVFNDIGISMLVIFTVGITFMPLLTDYGLLEFVGTLARRPFRTLFRLPGRAAVDTVASIVSASSIGLLVTLYQYERGFYSAREASIIACNFSIVSIPFCLLIADVAELEALFFGWYLSVVLACLVCAAVLARIPPLATLPVTYLAAAPPDAEVGGSQFQLAYRAAVERASSAPGLNGYLRGAWRSYVETTFAVIGPAMTLATLAAIAIFHTPLFQWLATPLRWLLEAGGVTQAALIAPGFLVGFVDQFMPAIIARSVSSEFWRFVLGGLSVTQLVFLSEFGVLVLRSKLPIDLKMLAIVFVQRTLITAPVLLAMAALLTA